MIMITPLYAALLTVLLCVLVLRVVRLRLKYRVALGDGGEKELNRAIRVHGNFIETAPWGIVLLLLLELTQAVPVMGLHVFGGLLCFARGFHAWGLTHSAGTSLGRGGGTVLTLLLYLVGAFACLWQYFAAL